jgi:OOP family OmpA-OmpF porin
MRFRIEGAFTLLLLVVAANNLFAQKDTVHRAELPAKTYLTNSSFRTWSIGVSGGISTPYTLIGQNSKQDFTSPDIQYGYGIYIKDQLTNSFGLQADLMTGKLQADHSNQTFPNGVYIYAQFDTKLNWSASLSGNFIIGHFGIMQPYVTLGGGVISYSAVLHGSYTNETVPVQGTLSNFFAPIGLGLKFNIARGINLDLGYQVNFLMSDNLDLYNYGSNNDKFSYTHIGLEFALGKRSKPQLAAQRKHKVAQNRNVESQPLITPVQTPQTVADSEKIKSEQVKRGLDSSNARLTRLTLDSDGDGVPDIKDKCPNTPPNTKVDTLGCPLPVNVIVKPTVVEVKQPVVATAEDKRIINIAAKSIEFYTGTEIISGRAFPNLNSVVKLLIAKKLYLKVNAYTNKAHSSDRDLSLAILRAEAVKNYMVNKGADGSKIEVEGHGGFAPGTTPATRRAQPNAGLIQLTLVQ